MVTPEKKYSYHDLHQASDRVASALLTIRTDWEGVPLAFLLSPGFEYLATLLGIWKAGGIAVPLCVSHPPAEWHYVLENTQTPLLIYGPEFEPSLLASPLICPLQKVEPLLNEKTVRSFLAVSPNQSALIIYTSGTTGKPKGAVTTHSNIQAHLLMLSEAWEWGTDDYILNVLPLHHVHGLINITLSALWNGACCYQLPAFQPATVWELFCQEPFSVFMAVPTVYSKLRDYYLSSDRKADFTHACHRFRLMVSGSAALPVSVLEQWQALSGHFLLERYGMTEIGMALSNPYNGERKAGTVGFPLPGVEVRVINENGEDCPIQQPGELLVKSPSVFKEYWQNAEATQNAFRNGWFLTGDVVEQDAQGRFTILGRSSVDILKTGGFKVSALEIEEKIRQIPGIDECAVVGLPDDTYGQVVALAVVSAKPVDFAEVQAWSQKEMAAYKVPRRFLQVASLPRNAMGKVMKPAVSALFG